MSAFSSISILFDAGIFAASGAAVSGAAVFGSVSPSSAALMFSCIWRVEHFSELFAPSAVPVFVNSVFTKNFLLVDIVFAEILVRNRACIQHFAFELCVDTSAQVCIQDSENRHTQNHSRETKESAAHDNRKHYPKACELGGFSENLRPDDISVDLLNDEDDNSELQCRNWFHYEQNDNGRNRSDKRARKTG